MSFSLHSLLIEIVNQSNKFFVFLKLDDVINWEFDSLSGGLANWSNVDEIFNNNNKKKKRRKKNEILVVSLIHLISIILISRMCEENKKTRAMLLIQLDTPEVRVMHQQANALGKRWALGRCHVAIFNTILRQFSSSMLSLMRSERKKKREDF